MLRGTHSGQRQSPGAEGISCWRKPEVVGEPQWGLSLLIQGLQLGLMVLVLVLAAAKIGFCCKSLDQDMGWPHTGAEFQLCPPCAQDEVVTLLLSGILQDRG